MSTHRDIQELLGQVVIVTGSGTNTGSTIAKTLANAGAMVVVNYRKSKESALETVRAIEASGGRALPVHADVCKREDVRRLIENTLKEFGAPNILVNNANVRSYRPLMDITIEEWRKTVG